MTDRVHLAKDIKGESQRVQVKKWLATAEGRGWAANKRRAMELWCAGLRQEDVATALGHEGIRVDQATVSRWKQFAIAQACKTAPRAVLCIKTA
jgi:hypothetical protein